MNEIANGLRIQIEFGSVVADGGKAFGSASVFHLGGEEVEKDEVDVLDLICALFDKLAGGQAVRNVAADAQAAGVRSFDDAGNEFRF